MVILRSDSEGEKCLSARIGESYEWYKEKREDNLKKKLEKEIEMKKKIKEQGSFGTQEESKLMGKG